MNQKISFIQLDGTSVTVVTEKRHVKPGEPPGESDHFNGPWEPIPKWRTLRHGP